MNIDLIRAAAARVTSAGQPYELIDTKIDDVALRVFKNAPRNLLELYRASLVHGNKDFYVYQTERYSFGETWRQAARVARCLQRSEVPGDRVGIAAAQLSEWIFAFGHHVGAVAVTMNAWWSAEELAYGVDDGELLFADAAARTFSAAAGVTISSWSRSRRPICVGPSTRHDLATVHRRCG
jgi:acyl-CoA synthetase (AMP-forming)/AMP-acid ligase II